MIDHTSTRIEQQETALRRQNRRRYAFQRMLEATDRVLWQLEEMNRDGVKTVPAPVRSELREAVELMPVHVREPLKDSGHVQDALDSLFEIQERLFRWRFPEWDDTEPDDFDYATGGTKRRGSVRGRWRRQSGSRRAFPRRKPVVCSAAGPRGRAR